MDTSTSTSTSTTTVVLYWPDDNTVSTGTERLRQALLAGHYGYADGEPVVYVTHGGKLREATLRTVLTGQDHDGGWLYYRTEVMVDDASVLAVESTIDGRA